MQEGHEGMQEGLKKMYQCMKRIQQGLERMHKGVRSFKSFSTLQIAHSVSLSLCEKKVIFLLGE
jgi:hypothetical protein